MKLPTRTIDTFFAGALGFDTLSASANAEAGLTAIDTGVLPFALSATSTAGTVACLKEPPSGLSVDDVCPGSSRGVFGYVSSPRPSWDSNQACNGGQNRTIQQNIAQGIDHNLTPWVATNVTDVCTNGVVIGVPNTLSFQTGNISSTIEDGFITGQDEGGSFADGGPARLSRPSPCVIQGGTNVRSLSQQPSITLEWCGVWDYMVNVTLGADPATQVPQACYDLKNQISSQNLAGVRACFDEYAAGGYTSRLFDISIRAANRFGWIPESIEDLDGTRTFRIQRFRATFVQTIYYVRGNNFVAYDPGEALPSGCGNCNNFSSVTALVFDSNMLPPEIRTPGSDNNIESSIALIR